MPFTRTVLVFQQLLRRLVWRLCRTQGCCLCEGRLDTAQLLPPGCAWHSPFERGRSRFLCGSALCLAHLAMPAPGCSLRPPPWHLDLQKSQTVRVDCKSFSLLN